MARASLSFTSSHYVLPTATPIRKINWVAGSDRPSIPTALTKDGATGYIWEFEVSKDGFIQLKTASATTGFSGPDLSDDWESNGFLILENSAGNTVRIAASNVSGNSRSSTSSPYFWQVTNTSDLTTWIDNTSSSTLTDKAITVTLDDGDDTTAPTVSSAATNTSGTQITITFDENLDTAHTPPNSAFIPAVGAPVTNVSISGRTVVLTLTTAITYNQSAVVVAYVAPAAINQRLQDASDNQVASVTVDVTNNVPAPVPLIPALTVLPVDRAFRLTATANDNGHSITKWQYKIATSSAGLSSASWTDISQTGQNLNFTTSDIGYSETRYFQVRAVNVAGNGIESAIVSATTPAEPDLTPPMPTGAETDTGGTQITITFDEPLDGSHIPPVSAFSPSVSNVAINGNTIVLTLSSVVRPGQVLAVSYTQSTIASQRIQDPSGNEAINFSRTVINRVPITAPYKPTAFTVSTINQTFQLQAIVDNRGSSITKWQYKIATSSAGLSSASWTDISQTSDNLNFITADLGVMVTRYFQVRAVNSIGNSPESDVVSGTTSDATPPSVNTIETDIDGGLIMITFNETLNSAHMPPATAFTVNGGLTVTNVNIAGAVVVLTLSGYINTGETITLNYAQPSTVSQRIQDPSGNEASSFSGQAVSNLSVAVVKLIGDEIATIELNGQNFDFRELPPINAFNPQPISVTWGGIRIFLEYMHDAGYEVGRSFTYTKPGDNTDLRGVDGTTFIGTFTRTSK